MATYRIVNKPYPNDTLWVRFFDRLLCVQLHRNRQFVSTWHPYALSGHLAFCQFFFRLDLRQLGSLDGGLELLRLFNPARWVNNLTADLSRYIFLILTGYSVLIKRVVTITLIVSHYQ